MDLEIRVREAAFSKLDPKGLCNPKNTVGVVLTVDTHVKASYFVDRRSESSTRRINVVISYLERLFQRNEKVFLRILKGQFIFLFQGDDRPVDFPSVAWQVKRSYAQVCLVPDFYYEANEGYETFLPKEPPTWSARKNVCRWRGATTGDFRLTLEKVKELPRYRLCERGLSLKESADFAFYSVAQAASKDEQLVIERHLRSRGILRPPVPLQDFSKCKMFVQIDGNGNSWEVMKKLRLGSCMLYVESEWKLWDDRKLERWKHYVPVSSDLNDIAEMIAWCLRNEVEAQEVARSARQLAVQSRFNAEMSMAAQHVAQFLTEFSSD